MRAKQSRDDRRTVGGAKWGTSPLTSDVEYTDEQREFLAAVAAYKLKYGRSFPTCCELLDVLKSLGYRKDAAPAAGGEDGR